MKTTKTVFGTPWIEIEFGERPEGWRLYLGRDECVKSTMKGAKKGSYFGGYLGPVRPLKIYEIPFEHLEAEYRNKLEVFGAAWTEDCWQPKFRDEGTLIKIK